MGMVLGPTESSIDLARDDTKDSERQVDASAYALAGVFGSVALPAGMPDYVRNAILDRAEQARDAAGDLIIDNRLNPNDAKTRQAKADSEDDDNLSQMAQIVRQEMQEREREEWSRTRSTVAGVTMTGAEWRQFAERLRTDEDLRRRLTERFEKEGATPDEAQRRIDRAAQSAEAASIPQSQRTPEQTKVLADPQAKADLRAADELKASSPYVSRNGLSGQFDGATRITSDVPQQSTSNEIVRPVVSAPGMGF